MFLIIFSLSLFRLLLIAVSYSFRNKNAVQKRSMFAQLKRILEKMTLHTH